MLGVYYLKSGRTSSAFEHLHLAERLVHDYPFPVLETKILLALSDVYEIRSEPDNAEWKRIAAVQVWNAPENIPFFVSEDEILKGSPYQALLDTTLEKVNQEQNLNRLIYQLELDHFTRLRRQAYERDVLYTNRVLSNQLKTIGDQIYQIVRELAERPKTESMSQRYNEALELWQQIWQKTLPYYRDLSVPSVADIQKTLNLRDKILVFLEGHERLGVLVITQNQAIAVSLGSKTSFKAMDDKTRFDYLEGRLGPVWNNESPLMVLLTPTLGDNAFIDSLKARMTRPDRLKLIFSLKSLVSAKKVGDCRKVAVIGPSQDSRIADLLRSLPRAGLTWLSDDKVTREHVTAALADHDQLIFIGPLSLDAQGLAYQCKNGKFFFHETINYPGLCNLTLISDSFDDWIPSLGELEIISPDASTSFYLLNNPNQYEKMTGKKYGLFFP